MIRLTDKKLPAGLHRDVSKETIHSVQVWPPWCRCGRTQRFLQRWPGAAASGITFPASLSWESQDLKPESSHCPETGLGRRVEWASLRQCCVEAGWPTLWTDSEVSCGTQADGAAQMQWQDISHIGEERGKARGQRVGSKRWVTVGQFPIWLSDTVIAHTST